MKILCLTLLAVLWSMEALAVNDKHYAGMRSMGMANATLAFPEEWSGVNNPSATAFYYKSVLAATYKSLFMINELGVKQALVNFQTKWGNFGTNLQQLSYAGYYDTNVGLSYARAFGERFSGGLQFDWLSVKPSSTEEMVQLFTAEISLTVKPSENWTLAFLMYNPFAVSYKTTWFEERVPVVARLGMLYSFSPKIHFGLEAETNNQYPINIKTGLEFQVANPVFIRMGAASEPQQITFGAGIKLKGCTIDMAIQQILFLERTAGVSISYAF